MVAAGETWNQFKLIKPIGKGGMGRVFLADDTTLDRRVAIKFLPDSLEGEPEARERFLREAKSAAALDHPYICKIYEIGEVDGKAFIAMEYVEGVTMMQKVAASALPLQETLDLGIEIAEALEAAHKKNIVHRDIKTQNIIVTPEGHIKILDFGVAKMLAMEALSDSKVDTFSGQLTSSSQTPGTVIYMSPEQVRGEDVDGRTDIFSLGIVLYEMAAGTIPYQGATSGLIYDAILNLGPRPPSAHNPDVPEELERVILKALEKDRDHRYQSAKDLMVDLKRMRRDSDTSAVVRSEVPARAPSATTTSSDGAGTTKSSAPWFALAGALAVLAALLLFWPETSTQTPGAIDSLAVLPFENSQNDPEIEYLGDGLAETLINRLSTLPQLQVMARSTSFRYSGDASDPQTVGRNLGVGAVLTGRVMQQGEDLNVQAELVDVENGNQLWGQQYTRPAEDILTVQNEIAQEISQALRLELSGEESSRLSESVTASGEAYQAYWQGRFYWNRRTNEDFKRAIRSFDEAKALDAQFALAHVGLADSYLLLGAQFYGSDEEYPPSVAMTKARTAARDALAIDPNLGEAYVTLAYISFLHDWNWADAEVDFRRAIELNPDYAVAHQWYSELLMVLGRHEEAVAAAQKALALDAGSPILTRELGYRFYQAKRYPESIDAFRQTLALQAGFPLASTMLIDAYWHAGEREEALALAEEIGDARATLLSLLSEDKTDEAEAFLDALPPETVAMGTLAAYYARAGVGDKAMDALEQAFRDRIVNLPLTLGRPDFDPWRSDPRFVDLEHNMGLAEAP